MFAGREIRELVCAGDIHWRRS